MEDGGQLEMSDADSLSSGDSGASDPSGVAPLEPGALGSPCVIPEGCDSGYCVAGRCCESACDGLCEACSEAGLCDAVPSDDSRCAPISCGAANLCVEFPEEQADDRCAALGSCKTACDPTYAGTGISCEEVAVDVAGSCDGSGTCTDPRALQGAACGSSRDCRDLSCVDGVCCAEPCDAPCESCDATGACVADPLESGCGDGLQCFGRGACLEPLGAACEADDDCGSGNCELAVGGGSACCAEACPASFRCNGDGQCVSPESDLGAACTTGAQCIGGRCFDGRCCDVACGGVCERCNAPGQEGRCVGAPLGSQEAECTGARECAGRGQCQLGLGSPCNLNDECRSGTCGAALQGTGEVCCEERCPSGQLCGPSGNCVDAPDPDGSPCTNGGDCISGDCVAGRCCETACNGLCEACSSLGDCNVNPGNDPRCPAVDCPTSNTVCRTFPADITTNLCGGLRSCRTAQSECQARFASAGTACENVAPGVVGRCDGAGNCQDPRVPNGTACNAGSQCTSGNCETPFAGQSNVCCAANCTGSQRCSQNFTSCVDCTPGERRCDPATGAPQRCSNGGQWQNDTACGQGQTCTGAGQCTCVSGQGLTNCGTACADLRTNANHCGECGRTCFPAQGGTCSAGSCLPTTPIAAGESTPVGVVLSDTHVFWKAGSLLRRVSKSGGITTTIFTGQASLSEPLIANNQLYFSNRASENGNPASRVMRANLDGTNISEFSPPYEDGIEGIAVSNGFVFHAVFDFGANATTFFRAPVLGPGQSGAGTHSNLGTVQGRGGSTMTAFADCIFYIASPLFNQIMRKCSAAQNDIHHLGSGTVFFRNAGSTDGTNLYFTDTRGLARIGLAVGSAVVPLTSVNFGVPTVDPFDGGALYYFTQTGSFGAPACTSEHTLFRAGRNPDSGNPVAILPPPHECPTQVAVDRDALYWSNREGGTVMKLGK